MTYSILLFITRNPALSPEQFKHHYENVHIPLAQRLCGDTHWPISFTRRYLARIARKGFGSPANPDNPPLLLRGDAQNIDYDCVAEMTFKSEASFQGFYKKIYEPSVAKILAADETLFLQVANTKAVVVAETLSTEFGDASGGAGGAGGGASSSSGSFHSADPSASDDSAPFKATVSD